MSTVIDEGTAAERALSGPRETAVLLHCTGGSGAQWRALAALLRDGFHVLAPDLYGYGGSGAWPGDACASLAAEGERVAAQLEASHGPVHLVGHSFGGAVALRLAQEMPARVASLTVIEPAAFHLLRDGDTSDAAALADLSDTGDALGRALLCGDYGTGASLFVDYWSGAGTWARLPDDQRSRLKRQLAKIVLDFWSALNEPSTLDDIGTLTMPTLVIRGARSPRPSRLIAEHVARVLPRATLDTIEGAGHMAPITHADMINARVVAHLVRHAQRVPT
jgi:pimeloyl-ACP methyl ester carboxylesterase